jgi:hypothetical protein
LVSTDFSQKLHRYMKIVWLKPTDREPLLTESLTRAMDTRSLFLRKIETNSKPHGYLSRGSGFGARLGVSARSAAT